MVNSFLLYKEACACKSKSSLNISYYQPSYQQKDDLKKYYIQIITTMFYELITKNTSPLLSDAPINYDNLIILRGLNSAFNSELDKCENIYNDYKNQIFTGKSLSSNYVSEWNNELQKLNENMEVFLSTSKKSKSQDTTPSKISQQPPEKNIPKAYEAKYTSDLNKIAETKTLSDNKLNEEIQQLQLLLQDELQTVQNSLKQISDIRDNIDYNAMQEPINQLLQLFDIMNDILKYHPNKEDQNGYQNLADSCNDFLAYIMQSLSMLGVTIINETEVMFDPAKHKSVSREIQPTRQSKISKILRIGFIYKDKVIEKAEVEITNPAISSTSSGFSSRNMQGFGGRF